MQSANLWGLKRLSGAVALAIAGAGANATTIYDYDTVATGAMPNSTMPWLTATLSNGVLDGVAGVSMQLDVTLDQAGEFVRSLLFNLDEGSQLGNIVQTGGSSIVQWDTATNPGDFAGGGQGNFKFNLEGFENDQTLTGTNSWMFFFAGLQEEDFWNTNGNGWWTMAHVQGVGENCSGWIGDNSGANNAGSGGNNVTDTSCASTPPEVPVPGTLGLLGLGLAALGSVRGRARA